MAMMRSSSILFLLMLCAACASFYEVHYDFNREFEQGKVDQALKTLRDDKRSAKGSSRFLYFVNNGLLLSMMGKYNESNDYFERAYLFGEDYRVNYAHEIASYLTNPQVTVYRGEDHEHLMLLYYKAMNFLKQNRYEEALVECRRLNIRLQQLSDKYNSGEKFQRDAFIHNLMGIIYQASGDWNNAFIAYRNALEIYETDYERMFKLKAPEQLKADLITAAEMTGFTNEAEYYRQEFSMFDFKKPAGDAELIYFWHNGLSPIKDEYNLTFVVNRNSDDLFVFDNKNLGLAFPFSVNNKDDRMHLSDLEVFRVAFPRYVDRPVYHQSAYIKLDSAIYPLQLTEDVNQIAFHSLRQRMTLEFSKTLLRAALKKSAEYALRKEDKTWGALLGMVNAVTEKADTRNWQTLPSEIYYARIPLNSGKNVTRFTTQGISGVEAHYSYTYHVKKGETLFHTFTSLEALPARYQ
jgi:uncharacterized protein